MDELDHIQDAVLMAQEAMLAERRRHADIAAAVPPPPSRECEGCGCDIPQGRLLARPTTRLCVDCQSELETVRR